MDNKAKMFRNLNRVKQGYIIEALPHNLTVDWVMQIVGVEEKRLKNPWFPWFNEEL